MDCAPLNLAHFHERRADKLIKRHRYNDAYKAIETSLLYVENAYKNVKIPKALEVLNTQKWVYERKLNQIDMCRQQYEKINSKETVPLVQIETTLPSNLKSDTVNAHSIARSIDKTIKEFNDKYGSTIINNNNCSDWKSINNQENELQNDLTVKLNGKTKESVLNIETNIRRLSLLDNQLDMNVDVELPSLAPLELPSFDYTAFRVPAGLLENFQK